MRLGNSTAGGGGSPPGSALAHSPRGAQDRDHPPAGDPGGGPRRSRPAGDRLSPELPGARAGPGAGARAAAPERPAADPRHRPHARRDRGGADAAPGRTRGRRLLRGEHPRGARPHVQGAALSAGGHQRRPAREPRRPGGGRLLPVDPQLRHADPLGLCRDAEACPPAPRRLPGGLGAAALRAAELVRPRRAHPRRRAEGAARGSGGRRTIAPTPGRSWKPSAAVRSAPSRRSPIPPGPARPRQARSPRPRRCRGTSRTRSGWRGSGRSSPPPKPGADRFRPLDPGERQRLRALYEADLERIARAWPDVLMPFEPRDLVA